MSAPAALATALRAVSSAETAVNQRPAGPQSAINAMSRRRRDRTERVWRETSGAGAGITAI
jgi:hypothetical protein